MAYKDLLVHVDDTRSCPGRLQAAVDLAVAHEAHLTGVYIIADPSPAAFVNGYAPPDLLEMLQQRARTRRGRARPVHRDRLAQPDLLRDPHRPGALHRHS
jgi:nucleotide-binding universal stress UspA family protein